MWYAPDLGQGPALRTLIQILTPEALFPNNFLAKKLPRSNGGPTSNYGDFSRPRHALLPPFLRTHFVNEMTEKLQIHSNGEE